MWQYVVMGEDETPDGYRDHLLYGGSSLWQVIKSIYVALKQDMVVTLFRTDGVPTSGLKLLE